MNEQHSNSLVAVIESIVVALSTFFEWLWPEEDKKE